MANIFIPQAVYDDLLAQTVKTRGLDWVLSLAQVRDALTELLYEAIEQTYQLQNPVVCAWYNNQARDRVVIAPDLSSFEVWFGPNRMECLECEGNKLSLFAAIRAWLSAHCYEMMPIWRIDEDGYTHAYTLEGEVRGTTEWPILENTS